MPFPRLYGVGIGATVVAACINSHPELFGSAVTDCGIFDLVTGEKSLDSAPCVDVETPARSCEEPMATPTKKKSSPFLDRLRHDCGDPEDNLEKFLANVDASPIYNIPCSAQKSLPVNTSSDRRESNWMQKYVMRLIDRTAEKFGLEPDIFYYLLHFLDSFSITSDDIDKDTDELGESVSMGFGADSFENEGSAPYPAVLVITGV